ncbi:unnamed protein product, partial [Prorocentrum cordatum]
VSESVAKTITSNHNTLLKMLSSMQGEVAKQSSAIESQVQSAIAPRLDSLNRRLQAQLDEQKRSIDALEGRADEHDKSIQELQDQLAELRRQMAIAEQTPRKQLAAPTSFDREEDTTIVVAVSQRPTTLASVVSSLRPWLSESGFDDEQYEIKQKGESPARRFEICFSGSAAIASRRASKATSLLKGPNGWKEFWVDPPGAERCRLHLGPDKSPKRIKTEVTLRKARAIIELQYPGKRFYSDREHGVLSIGWDKIMQVSVFHGDTPPKIYWDSAQLAKHAMAIDTLRNAVKEVHQDHCQLVSFFRSIASGLTIHSSFTSDADDGHRRGGVAVVLPPLASQGPSAPSSSSTVLVPGRVMLVRVWDDCRTLDIFNVHNHGLSAQQVREVAAAIRASQRAAALDPDMYTTFVLGDFNFATHEALALAAPAAAVRKLSKCHHVQAPKWRQALALLTEIACEDPTHYEKFNDSCATIDRVFCSITGWQLCQLFVQIGTLGSPAAVFGKKISDHAAVVLSLACRPPRPVESRPIPKHLFSEPGFKRRLEGLCSCIPWDSMSPPFKVEKYKELLKIAAAETRDALFRDRPHHPRTCLLLARALARVVWRQDVRMASRLQDSHPLAIDMISVTNGKVEIRHPPSFQAWVDQVQTEAAESAKGQELFANTSDTIQIFLPKNVTDLELRDASCSRSPDKVRVLGLRNCDLKLISSTVNRAIRPALISLAPPCQRGFIPGRNFGNNILELDVSSRQMSIVPHGSSDIPVLYSLDFGQAFPSLNQDFLILSLRALKLPDAFVSFVAFLYASVEGVVSHLGSLVHIFWTQSGIIQGCALSGTLYALSTAVFLVDLASRVEAAGLGLVRACADDIGGTLLSIRHLVQVYQVMKLASDMANLALKVSKCKIVPLSDRFSPSLSTAVSQWVSRVVPEWSSFEVAPKLLYLGLWMGPAVVPSTSWIDPVAKLRLRAQAIGRGTTPASLSATLYNTRAVTTISYVAQFCWPPASVLQPELSTLAQVFRIPLGTFALDHWTQLALWGGPRCTRWGHLAAATISRAALHTFPAWEALLQQLRDHASSAPYDATLSMLASGKPYPSFWLAPAFVENLELAAAGTPPPGPLAVFGARAADAALAELREGGRPRPRPQRAAHVALRDLACLNKPITDLFVLRLRKFAGRSAGLLAHIDWGVFKSVLARCPCSWAMAVLRTWTDGWMTSARIISPEGQKPCVFGCLGKLDSLRHYARCPVMHRALRQALARPFPLPWMTRWGLSDPSLATFSAMAAAYNMYNEASCALAGARSMQLASPMKCTEIDRDQLVSCDAAGYVHPIGLADILPASLRAPVVDAIHFSSEGAPLIANGVASFMDGGCLCVSVADSHNFALCTGVAVPAN